MRLSDWSNPGPGCPGAEASPADIGVVTVGSDVTTTELVTLRTDVNTSR